MATRKISVTKNYRLFGRSDDNRPLDIKKHKRLEEAMKEYGFLPCFPIVCFRDSKGNLIVKDGQHRLSIAELLGLPVYYVEESIDFDVAIINTTARIWTVRDYAEKYAANGIASYQQGIEFADNNNLPIGIAFALLGGTTDFKCVEQSFVKGLFRVKDRPYADSVASLYGPITGMASALKNSRFLQACMAVCRVEDFDRKRMLQCADRCRDKLLAYSTRDAYLDMLDEIYNFGRSKLFALKHSAITAMRDRNAAEKSKATKAAKKRELVAV